MWYGIKGFEHYKIDKKGNVKSLKSNKILKPRLHDKGYLRISLRKDGKTSSKYVHRLIAETFIENPHKCEQVHHKDGNKLNNDIDNLEWVNPTTHSHHTYMRNEKKFVPIPIIVVKVDGSEIKNFESIEEAAYQLSAPYEEIKKTLTSITKTINGYYWLYKYN